MQFVAIKLTSYPPNDNFQYDYSHSNVLLHTLIFQNVLHHTSVVHWIIFEGNALLVLFHMFMGP